MRTNPNRRRKWTRGMTVNVLDTFTDIESTNLEDHTPDLGGPWLVNALETWKIYSNRAGKVNSGLVHRAWIETGLSDCTISVTYNPMSESGGRSVVFRYIDEANYWDIHWENNLARLYVYEAGIRILIDTASPPQSTNTDYLITVVLNGNSILVSIDGSPTLSGVSEVHATATKHGIVADAWRERQRHDNFTVEAL